MKATLPFLGLFCYSLSSSAAILDVEQPTISKIEGHDLTCSNNSAMFAINSEAKKVWQAEPGEDQGIELKVNSFATKRCPYCFHVSAELQMFGQSLPMELHTSSSRTGQDFVVTLSVESEGQEPVLLPCSH